VEAVVYAAALARWSGRLIESADALTVPSEFALARLRELGAPLDGREVSVVAHPVEPVPQVLRARPAAGEYALFAGRLAHDKGPDLAIAACAAERIPLVVAGDGPQEGELRALAARLGGEVTFSGRVDGAELARLRAGAALAIVPSRLSETFGLSCAEAMAAGLPVAATRAGALGELLPDADLAPREDVAALGALTRRLWGDAAVGERNARTIARAAAPAAVAERLAAIYRDDR
jgi:glycosyltransferase involved in cell wall biosynthesis